MIPYSYSVLRYIHDGVTAEFVNVGVAIYSVDASYLKAKCTIQYGRITRMFDRIDGDRFKQLVKKVLPPDDSAIQFSPEAYGVSADLEKTLGELFER